MNNIPFGLANQQVFLGGHLCSWRSKGHADCPLPRVDPRHCAAVVEHSRRDDARGRFVDESGGAGGLDEPALGRGGVDVVGRRPFFVERGEAVGVFERRGGEKFGEFVLGKSGLCVPGGKGFELIKV